MTSLWFDSIIDDRNVVCGLFDVAVCACVLPM